MDKSMNTTSLIMTLHDIAHQAAVNAEDIQLLSDLMEQQQTAPPGSDEYFTTHNAVHDQNKRMLEKQDIAIQLLAVIKDLVKWTSL